MYEVFHFKGLWKVYELEAYENYYPFHTLFLHAIQLVFEALLWKLGQTHARKSLNKDLWLNTNDPEFTRPLGGGLELTNKHTNKQKRTEENEIRTQGMSFIMLYIQLHALCTKQCQFLLIRWPNVELKIYSFVTWNSFNISDSRSNCIQDAFEVIWDKNINDLTQQRGPKLSWWCMQFRNRS